VGFSEYRVQKTIIKAEKNWRLDGALIPDPPDQPGRFDALEPDDFAVFNFIGETTPQIVQCLLVAGNSSADQSLFQALSRIPGFGLRTGMVSTTEDQLVECGRSAGLPDHHPLYALTLDHDLREAVEGSADAVIRISHRIQNQTITRAQLARLRESADWNGQLGESLVYIYFQDQVNASQLSAFTWVSDTNATSPFDFAIELIEGRKERIDVKTTSGRFDQPIYVSFAELMTMTEEIPYRIYRVYDVSPARGSLLISEPVNVQARELLDALKPLPIRVSPTGFQIRPDFFTFVRSELPLRDASDDEF
jgi:hypothetical protein